MHCCKFNSRAMEGQTAKKIVALIDFHVEGHHPVVNVVHARALLELGHEVWIFYPDADPFDSLAREYGRRLKLWKCRKFDLHRKPLAFGAVHKALSIVDPSWGKWLVSSFLWLKSAVLMRRAVRSERIRPDLVIFTAVDGLISVPFPAAAASRFRYPWLGDVVGVKNKSGRFKVDWRQTRLSGLEYCLALYILEETAVEDLRAAAGKPVYFYPNVTDETVESVPALEQRIREKARGRKVVLLAGTIESRKGIIPLINVIRASRPGGHFFVIAGKLYPDSFEADELELVDGFLGHPPENCLAMIGRVADEKSFNALVRSADIVYAAYIGFMGSSGIMTKAALFKKPIIVSKGGLMGYRAEKYRLGAVIDPSNPPEIAGAIEKLSHETAGDPWRLYGEYFAMHSYARLKEILSGLPSIGGRNARHAAKRRLADFLRSRIPGKIKPLARRLRLAIVYLTANTGPYVRSRSYCGFRLYYNRDNQIVRRLKSEPIYERGLCARIVDALGRSSNKVFLDVGANIGLISLYVASHAPGSRIHAFEPGPSQRSFLEMTVVRNDLSHRMRIHAEALGETSGLEDFYAHAAGDAGYDGFAETGRAQAGSERVKVRVTTIDSWWLASGRPKVGAVKIDVEGAELMVLRGGRRFLSECRPDVFMEIDWRNLKAYPYGAADILCFLADSRYRLFTLDGLEMTAGNLEKLGRITDTYVARPAA